MTSLLVAVDADLARGAGTDTGRPGLSAEKVQRGLVVRQAESFRCEHLAFHVEDAATFRRFCRFGVADDVPHASTWQDNIKRLPRATREAHIAVIVGVAKEGGVGDGWRACASGQRQLLLPGEKVVDAEHASLPPGPRALRRGRWLCGSAPPTARPTRKPRRRSWRVVLARPPQRTSAWPASRTSRCRRRPDRRCPPRAWGVRREGLRPGPKALQRRPEQVEDVRGGGAEEVFADRREDDVLVQPRLE